MEILGFNWCGHILTDLSEELIRIIACEPFFFFFLDVLLFKRGFYLQMATGFINMTNVWEHPLQKTQMVYKYVKNIFLIHV